MMLSLKGNTNTMCCSPPANTETYPSLLLPLSLVWLLVRNLSHPDPGVKLLELDPPKGLGQEVGELVLGVDVVGPDTPSRQLLMK
jgi:hypothetical protein